MKTPVIITKKTGANSIFTPNTKLGKDGESYGFLRGQQSVLESKGGIVSVKTRSALIPFKSSEFEKVKSFITEGTVMEGKIIRVESLEPEYEGQPQKQVPRFDANRQPLLNADGTPKMRDITSNGQKIWSKDKFVSDSNAEDKLCSPYDTYVETELAEEELEVGVKGSKVTELP